MANINSLSFIRPGEVRNPKGREPGSKNRNRVARLLLQLEGEALNELTGQTEWLTNEDLITIALVKKAMNGDVAAYTAIMDSAYGKPKQEIETLDRTIILTDELDEPGAFYGELN